MKTTREGKRFLLATLLVAAAAANTGNNLIYLILSLMFAFIIISAVALRLNLRNLKVSISNDRPVFAGRRAKLGISIENRRTSYASYSVKIESPSSDGRVYFEFIPAAATVGAVMATTIFKRGVYSGDDLRIGSGFPFILFEKSLQAEVSGSVLVYPVLLDIENIAGNMTGEDESRLSTRVGQGDEIHSIREFRQGDDRRRIHWKATAKSFELMVKEFSEHEGDRISIFLDNLKPDGGVLFEKAVSLAGSLALHFIRRGGLVRVITCGESTGYGSGEGHYYEIMDMLAMISETDECGDAFSEEAFLIAVMKSSAIGRAGVSAKEFLYADRL